MALQFQQQLMKGWLMVKKYFLFPGVLSSWAGLEHPPLFPGQHRPYLYNFSGLPGQLFLWFSPFLTPAPHQPYM